MSSLVALDTAGLVETWPFGFDPADCDDGWTIAHCMPRQEKRFVGVMNCLGIPGCMLMEARLRRYRGKGLYRSTVPLLGGYVFLQSDWRDDDFLYDTGRLVRIIRPRDDDGQQRRLSSELHALIRLLERSEHPLIVRPKIVPGRTVQVIAGALSGCEGVVIRRHGISEIVVNLHLLGCSVATHVAAEFCELIEQ